jgi:hypothetical protein
MLLGVLINNYKGIGAQGTCALRQKGRFIGGVGFTENCFVSNGYPEQLVQKTVQESWAKETLKAILVGIEQDV